MAPSIDELPVWTIRPNWRGGILERLEWKTDVLASESNHEQRRLLRRTPRRSFEITVNPTAADRAYLDLILHRLGGGEWAFPLWHDQGTLVADANVGAEEIVFDNRWREHMTGGRAILYKDRSTWETVEIGEQTETGFAVLGGTVYDWPAGTRVYPLRRCLVRSNTTLTALTGKVGQAQLLFQVNEPNPLLDGTVGTDFAETSIGGVPVITQPPNRSREITTDQVRFTDEQDGETGLVYRVDLAGRSFNVQAHNWLLRGRPQQAAFRAFLYGMRGRQGLAWLPTFNDDVTLAADALQGANRLTVDNIGYRYVAGAGGAPIAGRERLWTRLESVAITGVAGIAGEPDHERLNTAVLANHYDAGTSFSFMSLARLNQDEIELLHHADSDGVMECSTTMAAVQGGRVPPARPVWRCPAGDTGGGGGEGNGRVLVQMQSVDPCSIFHGSVNQLGIGPAYIVNTPGGVAVGNSNQADSRGVEPLHSVLQEANNPSANPALRGQSLIDFERDQVDNFTYHLNFYPEGSKLTLQWQPAAFYCGNVGKQNGEVIIRVIIDDEIVDERSYLTYGNAQIFYEYQL